MDINIKTLAIKNHYLKAKSDLKAYLVRHYRAVFFLWLIISSITQVGGIYIILLLYLKK